MKTPAIAVLLLALAGCACRPPGSWGWPPAAPAAPERFVAAVPVRPAPPPAAPQAPEPPPGQMKPLPPPEPADPPGPPPSPEEAVEEANAAARLEPAGSGYVNAIQVFPWSDGALYQVYAAPGQVTDVALAPGERLVSMSTGDTVRWMLGNTASGSGTERRTHVLVKPVAAGLATNLVITTDRRVYHVELRSTEATYMASVSWTYPGDGLPDPDVAGERAAAPSFAVAGIEPSRLRFGYRVEGDSPPWRPLRAFDDGRSVFIQFPPGAVEAPPLFVLGAGGGAELVNYRVEGSYYVVDRLFRAAELRLGGRRPAVVRVVREP